MEIELKEPDLVQFSVGHTDIRMTLDAAYDLQYTLAKFLAELEMNEVQSHSAVSAGGTVLEFNQTCRRDS